MNCLLTWLSTCLISPENAYLTAAIYGNDINRQDSHWCRDHWCQGPIGELKLGLVIDLSDELSLDVGYSHRSYITESRDKGANVPYASLTWRPWR